MNQQDLQRQLEWLVRQHAAEIRAIGVRRRRRRRARPW
jgi:hypothetical protein